VFLLYNVAFYQGDADQCCIVGYHGAFLNPAHKNGLQTYVVADFDSSGAFSGTDDVTDLSHEIAELINDPIGNNPTPPWGNVGQVSGCQSNLEVGDPLSGTEFSVRMRNGYTYHPQDLAFKSWFFDDTPSSGVNGWYSFDGTLTTPAEACP
jgi:hypothetical protein